MTGAPGACPDPRRIREAVRARYRGVAAEPKGQFPYPVGRESLERLGYAAEWIDALPPRVAGLFVGVGNPFSVRRPREGDRVLDAGCGGGADAFVAARLAGPGGRVAGVDLAPEMLEAPREEAARAGARSLSFLEGSVEALPFPDGSFDLVLANGSLNLVPDKDAAFAEIARVLRPGGALAAADLVLVGDLPAGALDDMDAWST